MGWKEKLQPASFRGAKFFVDTAEVRFGRRNQLHEYPKRDEPYSEDLGKKAREYTFNAYILGDDYFRDRDALIKAIEEDATPGTLVHPTLGSKLVVPRDCSDSYSNKEGGIEYLTLTFAEAGEKKFPASGLNLKSLVGARSEGLISAATSRFEQVYKVADYIDDVAIDANVLVEDFLNVIDDALKLGSVIDPFYSAYKGTIGAFRNTIESLIPDPIRLGGNIADTVTGLTGVFSSPELALKAQAKVFEYGNGFKTISETTPTKAQKAANQEIMVSLVRSIALSQIAVSVAAMEFPSKQDAMAQRDAVVEKFEQEIDRAGDTGEDDIYQALEDLQGAMVREVNQRAIALPNLRTIKLQDFVPALVLAYRLYKDSSRDQEIVDRNRIRNPLFVPANTDIEVLA